MSLSFSEHIAKLVYWKSNPEWYAYYNEDDETEIAHLTDKAPPEAIESYNYAMAWHEKQHSKGVIAN